VAHRAGVFQTARSRRGGAGLLPCDGVWWRRHRVRV